MGSAFNSIKRGLQEAITHAEGGSHGRIAISVCGVIVAMLSLTGALLWFKRRSGKARRG